MSDPKAIAKALTDQITALYAAANAPGLAALYGADSVAIYEGNIFGGAADISARVLGGRLSGGPMCVVTVGGAARARLLLCTARAARPHPPPGSLDFPRVAAGSASAPPRRSLRRRTSA